ncbi:unnamed protein product, partial [Mesorhabditis belari]|uniref:Uncharacterized protein n=1 Tax=Mesorhabditis belari TaxID=2138241 RepID=A0AAF3F063_9BILA
MEAIRPRFEANQKETAYANEDRVDSRSASLPINLPRPDSPEYDEISDTEIDQFVSKPLDDDAVREMNFKFGVLKAILEVNVRQCENEIIRRTEDPRWTGAQRLKRKVLHRRQTKPTKKKICAQRVGDVFNELLAEEFRNVLACGPLSISKISALIEYSKSKRDFFSKTLCKYDKYGELPGLLEKVLVNNWICFFYDMPHKGFGERDTVNEYERVRRDLPLNVPHGTHLTLLCDIKEWFIEMKNKREREERERRENEEKQRQAEILKRLEVGNPSRKRFSFPNFPTICNSVTSLGTTSQYQERPQAIHRHQPGQETLLMIEEEIIDDQPKKAMEIEQDAERDELWNKIPTLGEVSTSRDASLGPSTVVMSASLPINFPRPDSPEYDEISDTEIDQYVSKPLEEDAVREMDFKFGVLKAILEVNVRQCENELIRRTENPKWTDAQKLKRKVLHRRKSNSTKKKICAEKVGDVFDELLAGLTHLE